MQAFQHFAKRFKKEPDALLQKADAVEVLMYANERMVKCPSNYLRTRWLDAFLLCVQLLASGIRVDYSAWGPPPLSETDFSHTLSHLCCPPLAGRLPTLLQLLRPLVDLPFSFWSSTLPARPLMRCRWHLCAAGQGCTCTCRAAHDLPRGATRAFSAAILSPHGPHNWG